MYLLRTYAYLLPNPLAYLHTPSYTQTTVKHENHAYLHPLITITTPRTYCVPTRTYLYVSRGPPRVPTLTHYLKYRMSVPPWTNNISVRTTFLLVRTDVTPYHMPRALQ